MEQDIRFCTSDDGVRLAYALTGSGPPLVRAAHWLTHIEYDLRSPVWRHWIEGFSSSNRLLRYDERGCGLSDWDVADFSLDAWVRDLAAVVEAAGIERFPLMGFSQGGPVAISYAVRHPERVSHLVIYGSYGRGWRRRGLSPEFIEENEALVTLAREGWGRESPAYRQLFAGLFVPDADSERLKAFNELQRVTTSPENAGRFLSAFGDLDIMELLPEVQAPTLVLHSLGDSRCPFDEGRRLAAGIADSRLVPLDSSNHILLAEEPAWAEFRSEIHSFIGVQTVRRRPTQDHEKGTLPSPSFHGRRVVRWTMPYAAGAWIFAQVMDLVREPWSIHPTTIRVVQILLLAGFFAVFALALVRDLASRRSS